MSRVVITLLLSLLSANGLRAQEIQTIVPISNEVQSKRQDYRLETHLSIGPMYSIFRERLLAPGQHKNTFGYQAVVRVMWHPDHLLAVGLMSGHQLISEERFTYTDANGTTNVHAWLSATPVMIDVSMQDGGFEIGSGLGGFIMRSVIDDRERSSSTRLELGTLSHVSYAFELSPDLYLGSEISVSYLSYRGILSFSPRLELRYDIRY